MTLAELLANLRAEPTQLYWHRQLLERTKPRVPRAMLFDSLRRVTRAKLPGAISYKALTHWTLQEALTWVSELRGADANASHVVRAYALSRLPMRRRDADAALRAARREFELAPLKTRRLAPRLWGTLLLKLDVTAFEAALEDILEGLRTDCGVSEAIHWLKEPQLSDTTRLRLERFFNELPDDRVRPTVRMVVAEREGLRALERDDLRSVRAALKTMTRWAKFDSWPGNRLELVKATITKGVLQTERRRFLTTALESEWRSWHRPTVERYLAA